MTSFFEAILKPGQQWLCLFAYDQAKLVGALPVLIRACRVAGLRRQRLAAPQRGEMHSGNFLAAAGWAGTVIPQVLSRLSREFPAFFELSLFRIPGNSPTLPVLQALPDNYICQEFGSLGSYLDTTCSAEAYRKTLSHNFSRNLTKARNKLSRLPEVRTLFLTGSEADETWLARFLDLEASGWKGASGTALKHRPGIPAFYQTLVRRLKELGWLEWHLLLSGEQLLAAHLAVKMHRRILLQKIAYNEAFSQCAPGNMLLEQTLQRAFADPATDEVDCFYEFPWQNNWAMQKRSYYDLWVYPREWLPFAFGVTPRRAKARLRQLTVLRSLYRYFRPARP